MRRPPSTSSHPLHSHTSSAVSATFVSIESSKVPAFGMEMLRDRRTVGIIGWGLTQLLALVLGICYFASASDLHSGLKFAFVWKGLWFWAAIPITYLLLFRKGTENAFSTFVLVSVFLNQIALTDSAGSTSLGTMTAFKSLSGFGWTYFFVSFASLAGIVSMKEEFVDIGPSFDDGGQFGASGDYHGPV